MIQLDLQLIIRVLLLNLKMNYVHFNITCICFKTYREIYDDDYNNE